jgi:hypothetical protein
MKDGEPEVIDMDSTTEEDDPKGEKPSEEKSNENMDIDGEKNEEQASKSDTDKRPPTSDNAGGGELQQEAAQASKKPVVVVALDGSGQWKANLVNPKNDSGHLNKMKEQNGGTVSPVRSS